MFVCENKYTHSVTKLWYETGFISFLWLFINIGAVDAKMWDQTYTVTSPLLCALHQYTATQHAYIQFQQMKQQTVIGRMLSSKSKLLEMKVTFNKWVVQKYIICPFCGVENFTLIWIALTWYLSRLFTIAFHMQIGLTCSCFVYFLTVWCLRISAIHPSTADAEKAIHIFCYKADDDESISINCTSTQSRDDPLPAPFIHKIRLLSFSSFWNVK